MTRHVSRAIAALVLVTGSIANAMFQPSAALAASEGAIAVQICGRLVGHRPATAAASGSLTIGTRTYVVAPGTAAGNGGVEVAVGRDLCVEGSAGRASGQLLRYLFFWMPPNAVCGNVVAVRGEEIDLRADFGRLTIGRGGLSEPRVGERVCYLARVTASGDLVAAGAEPVDTDLERERVSHCGTVRAYRPATSTDDGVLTIGSETFVIARGTPYTGDPAGDRTDRTSAGQSMCVSGVRGSGTALIEYLTQRMPLRTGGRAVEYAPPSAKTAGIATLSYRSQHELRIPAEIDAAIDVVRVDHCFTVGVDAAGDAAATAVMPCELGRAAAAREERPPPSAPPLERSIVTLPSTSVDRQRGSASAPLAIGVVVLAIAAGVAIRARRLRRAW